MKRRSRLRWIDPVSWSEQFAKTKLRVFIWALIHLVWGFGILISANAMIQRFRDVSSDYVNTSGTIIFGGLFILQLGIIYPIMYLYAMHRLLRMLREKDVQSESAARGIVKGVALGDGS